ncbi:trehalose operon repressor [Tuanshanicoccus lijuaniae]|uniref:trehalose operon repressor n=1 Tax=Aerococcaceae bacterium zg-1292 TaxID=2774330 RepID=UPI0019373D4E|nr:trehalose operon repressor [Aerococcaceae bacterium zg-1292]MBF6625440.1 trehalose operon repressor [Aerococcaceae bacterium zg-BR9]MBF6979101.1 trehalose operon repressor [Aerococcaceae bacterium zg-BR22]MBS4456328.1 trehalose operon repressor [Aerococcaceae bacterium zg-A91]MBS4458256.1 trehalose operon repressor [Aerococcaceae bacterium zg-BR33]
MNKFERIYLDIEKKIKTGVFPIGSLIPSEHDLAETYGVSRETIRKAQKLLLENGFIQKKQGRGSVVLDFHRFSFPISGLVSHKELQDEQGIQSETQIILNDIEPTPEFLVGKFDIRPGEKFIHLVRTRSVKGEVMIVDEDYIRCKYVPNIPHSHALRSIYHYFEEELNLEISYANKYGVAEKANEMGINLMKLTPLDYVINVSSEVFLEDTSFFQYTTSYHRLEKFSFSEFARRRKRVGK